MTQLTTWNDWQAVQEFSWGWHWSTFKNIGCYVDASSSLVAKMFVPEDGSMVVPL